VAIATDENAELEISGFDSLQPGDNSPTVTVTAPDGTVQVYTIAITVELSSETGVTEILVDGKLAEDGDVIRTTDTEMTEVDVEVSTVDGNATVEISGNTELVVGDNEITITVTAPNGDSRSYTVVFRIGGLSGNAKLSNLSVNGKVIDLAVETTTISVIAGTRFVPVIANAHTAAPAVDPKLVESMKTSVKNFIKERPDIILSIKQVIADPLIKKTLADILYSIRR
jgi:hypothetical protein